MEKSLIPVVDWTVVETKSYLQKLEFDDKSIALLCDENKINGKCLLSLNDTDFTIEPISHLNLRDRKCFYIACKFLQKENLQTLYHLGLMDDGCSNVTPPNKFENEFVDLDYTPPISVEEKRAKLPPEKMKAFLSFCYVVVVTWITAFVMVIVHDRVPDMKKYPPLPDIFLDNIPHIPWAFDMCEVTGTLMFTIWLLVLLFHKHRFILMRRFFALSGTVFLLRCITMLITSLSVPGSHLQCQPKQYSYHGASPLADLQNKMSQAYIIWRGAGMSIQGVRTCGDYMFSGHTVALTMLNFFITEYTPRRVYYVHTFSWMMNMFGIFFILAAHEHYSIDVFVAFYITSRLFLYYHTLSNNQALMQKDSNRTKIWFPLFSYFESGMEGIVPNEYDTPTEIAYSFVIYLKELVLKLVYLCFLPLKNQNNNGRLSNSNVVSSAQKNK